MKIGMITDSLGELPFDGLLDTAAGLGIEQLEFAGGNWSRAPHLPLDTLIESAPARREFAAKFANHRLSVSALNCSGNPVHPGEHGRRHREVTRKTIMLAGLMGFERVVMMSGCPDGPGDANANWVTTSWPPEMQAISGRRCSSPFGASSSPTPMGWGSGSFAWNCTAIRRSTMSKASFACATRSATPSASISIPAIPCGWGRTR